MSDAVPMTKKRIADAFAQANKEARAGQGKNAYERATMRAHAFLNQAQFIEADRNIARCYLELKERLEHGLKFPTSEEMRDVEGSRF